MFKKLLVILIFVVSCFLATNFVLAQPATGVAYAGNIGLQGGGNDIRDVLVRGLQVVLGFLGIIAVLIVMWGGWLWMTSNGDPAKIDKAKKTLISAVIGLFIILAAFMVVTWIINTTSNKILGSPSCNGGPACVAPLTCCAGGCQIPPCSSITPLPDSFYITRFVPPNALLPYRPRNVRVKVFFNRPILTTVTQAELEANFVVSKTTKDLDTVPNSVGLPVNVPGSVTISGDRQSLIFAADAVCDNEAATPHCFDEWSEYQATIDGSSQIVSAVGGLSGVTQSSFSTNDGIDTEPPTANIFPRQMCHDDGTLTDIVGSSTVYGFGRDDFGVSQIDFSQQRMTPAGPEVLVDTIPGNSERYQHAEHIFDTSIMAVGDEYRFEMEVADMVTATSVDDFTTTIREPHCCDGVQNGGETDIDCGGAECDPCGGLPVINWISPSGGFCRDINDIPTNIPCRDDSPCGTGNCDLVTPNGAAGNFVTISGKYFGSDVGRVEFQDEAGNVANAFLANDTTNGGNANCGLDSDVWQSNQIIVLVPSGLNMGTGTVITVIRATDSASDSNAEDGNGPFFDFVLNNLERPGICLLTPDEGVSNTTLSYEGIRLVAGSQSYFGTVLDSLSAINSSFTGVPVTNGTAVVPVIKPRKTTTYVENPSAITSNYLDFKKLKDPYTGPYITSFSPVKGPEKQYVTIYGSGFGDPGLANIGPTGAYHVYFDADHDLSTAGDQQEASYDFPKVCENSIWRDNQIVVKVPDSLTDDTPYYFIIDIAGTIIDSQGVVDESGAAQETFFYDKDLPLAPGLCKLEPQMGENGSDIALWGEYFDDPDSQGPNTSKVWFHLNEEIAGFNNSNWRAVGDADKIDTLVPIAAITGLVKVEDTFGSVGNGLEFKVGKCISAPDPNTACGRNATNPDIVCCPEGTFEADSCQSNIDSCYGNFNSSVYEWGFKTGTTSQPFIACYDAANDIGNCNPLNPPCPGGMTCNPNTCSCQPDVGDSCAGFNLLQCDDGYFCPNSPGVCDIGPYDGSVASCDCDTYFPGKGLVYNATKNKCENTTLACSIDEDGIVSGVDLSNYQAFCGQISGNYYWQMDPGGSSCPDSNWVLNTEGNCTLVNASVGVTCNPCTAGMNYQCISNGGNDNAGTCMVNQTICSGSSSGCDAGTGLCIEPNNPSNSCECCCEIGSEAEQCCSYETAAGSGIFESLTCEGDCGQDAVAVAAGLPDPNLYGSCTGCSAAPDPDAACNCSGTTGKYCDTTAAGGRGVCKDCATISTEADCRDKTTCCADAAAGNACRGVIGTARFDTGVNEGMCSYYECAVAGGCDSVNPLLTGTFKDLNVCTSNCSGSGPSAGESCFDPVSGNCGLVCSLPVTYSCLGDTGCSGPPPPPGCDAGDESCLCCCDTDTGGGIDSCVAGGLTNLNCIETEPCSGGDRGLCCGCSADAECDTGSPDNVGCGYDTCCRPRPFVTTVEPGLDDTNVCRNVKIEAEFDKSMNLSSFSGNVLLVGDYGYDECPANTQFLTRAATGGKEKYKNIFVRVFYKMLSSVAVFLKNILPLKLSAYFSLDLTHNYCAVSGRTSGYTNAAGDGVLEFYLNKVLDPERNYYVIIKGDDNLDSSRGVKNSYNIAMNAGIGSAHISPSGNAVNEKTFNGIHFKNAYIWSFKTMGVDVANEGICEIEKIEMIPESWLFKTNKNDKNEVDTDAQDPNYNTTADSDKEFIANVLGPVDTKLSPIPGVYNWAWNWTTNNAATADSVTVPPVANLDTNKSLIRANATAVDGKAVIAATASITENTIGAAPGPYVGTSDVYVFLCDNPWPPVSQGPTPPKGNWKPWSDKSANCTVLAGGCDNTNYEIYYCRDAGGETTADDLPSILDDNTVIRGRSNFSCKGGYYDGLACSMGSTDCALPAIAAVHTCDKGICKGEATVGGDCSVATDCDSSGICDGVLKDAYFFREALPDISSIDLRVDNIPVGGESIELNWIPVTVDPGETLDYYLVYYGKQSGNYTQSVDVPLSSLDTATYPGRLAYTVTGLTNNVKYYFSVTARYVSGAESKQSIETSAMPKDNSSAGIPANFIVTSEDQQVELSWDANVGDDTAGYEVCYGMSLAGVCANVVDMGTDTELAIDSLNNGVSYYFGVRSYDDSGIRSSVNSMVAMPFAKIYSPVALASSTNSAVIDLSWNLDLSGANNSGVSDVRIYWGTNPVSLSPLDLGATPSSYRLSTLTPNTTYYFQIVTLDTNSPQNESELTDIIEATTSN